MRTFNVTVNGQTYEVSVEEVNGSAAPARAAAPVVSSAAPKAAPKAAAKLNGFIFCNPTFISKSR